MVDINSLVFKLQRLGAPLEFVLIVLLAIWTEGLYDLDEAYDWLEFFAGHAACTCFARLQGFRGCKFDLKYNSTNVPPRKSNYMDVNSTSGFVLCIIFLLKGRPHDFLAWYGIKCSSWTQINVGTSSRAACCSAGNMLMASVGQANRMLERISLLLILTVALGGVFVLEQPGGSLLEFYPTFRWALAQLIEIHGIDAVCRVHWSMGAFGGETAKPQYAYSNSPAIRKLHHFRPTSANHVKKGHTKVETCKKYKNREGKDCYVGTKQLRDTEIYPDYFASTIAVLIDDLRAEQRGTPKVPDSVPPALESFLKLKSGQGSNLFESADLASVFRYLRKGQSLRIPDDWAQQVPKSI